MSKIILGGDLSDLADASHASAPCKRPGYFAAHLLCKAQPQQKEYRERSRPRRSESPSLGSQAKHCKHSSVAEGWWWPKTCSKAHALDHLSSLKECRPFLEET